MRQELEAPETALIQCTSAVPADPEHNASAVPADPGHDTSAVPADLQGNRRDGESTLVKRQGYFLPHWTLDGAIYHVVFRLRDSLPQDVLRSFESERDILLRLQAARPLIDEEEKRLRNLVSRRVNEYLDRGHGECLMRRPEVAAIVQGALAHFHGERYSLHAWAVMPNHVHAIVEPLSGWELPRITHSWKSFTAHEINRLLARTGVVWHKESFDHIIRSERAYCKLVDYVVENPQRAHLHGWKWVGSNAKELAN
jgi:REP element-mobilizing transposase RayT